MDAIYGAALFVIGLAWFAGWRVGCRWCRASGIDRRLSVLALGAVLPSASLLLSVQIPATIGLFLRQGIVTPVVAAVTMVCLTLLAESLIRVPPSLRVGSVPESANDPALALGARSQPPGHEMLGLWVVLPIVVAGMYLIFTIDAVTRFPTGYDGLNYHLPVMASWMNTGTLDLTVGLMHESLPENAMITPLLLSFVKAERLMNIVFLPCAMIVGVVVYELSRLTGTGSRAALAAACIALSIPMVVFQSFSSYVDLYAAAAWLVSLLGLVWVSRVETKKHRVNLLIMAGLPAGIALGSKTTYLVLASMLLIVAVATCGVRAAQGGPRLIGRFRTAAIFGMAMLACSGFWFLRGATQAGNPLYPLGIEVAGKQVLPGFVLKDHVPPRELKTELGRWWNYSWRETNYSGTGEPYSVNNALGASFATFIPLGILSACVSYLRRRRQVPTPSWQMVNLVILASGLALFFGLYSHVLRYVLPLIVLCAVVAAPFIGGISRAMPRSSLALLVASLSVTTFIAALSPARALAGRVRDGNWDRAAFYEIPRLVDRFEPGSRVLSLAPAPLAYPLLGANLSNDVVHGVYWQNNLNGSPMNTAALLSAEIDYVFVRQPWPTDWPVDLPVELIYDNTDGDRRSTTAATRIYKVTPSIGDPRLAALQTRRD